MTGGASGRWARAAKKAGLVSMGLVVGLLLCEALLRIAGYRGDSTRPLRVFGRYYGTVREDSWIFRFDIDPEKHSHVELRGQLIPIDKKAGETRVLFIGDSATEGAFVDLEQSYPLQFEKLLQEHGEADGVRVINAGVWGMTPIDARHFLQDELLQLQPDVVVFGLFMANDINFNLAHPQYETRHGSDAGGPSLRAHSALAHFLYLQALAYNARHRLWRSTPDERSLVPVEVGLVDDYGLHMLSYPEGELATYMRPPSALVERAFDVLEETLRQLRALGDQHGFELVTLIIPTPSTVAGHLRIVAHPEILQDLAAKGVHVDERQLDFAQPRRRVLAICDRLRLRCIDATPELKRVGPGAFFPHDEHPTAAGHRALSRALWQN